MSADAQPLDFSALRARERRMRDAAPAAIRMRDAAERLGAPEAALLEARIGEGAARRLAAPEGEGGLARILAGLPALGPVMCLTRNDHCVHEKTGVVAAPEFFGTMGQVVGQAVDLRIFSEHWATAYALEETTETGPRRSLQFFDPCGDAVLKIWSREGTDMEAWTALAATHESKAAPPPVYAPRPAAKPDRPDSAVDVQALRSDWAALTHSHEFHKLLRRHDLSRLQALRLVGPDFARPLAPEAAAAALQGAAEGATPLMVFVANRGCVQIHSGPVDRIVPMGPWLNVLDPGFNLHLRTDRAASSWLVRKPGMRGDVHSLELFAADGAAIVQIFGERKAGETERDDWRALARGLPGADFDATEGAPAAPKEGACA